MRPAPTLRSPRGCSTGLAQDPPAIPARWFYDEAGSQLFDAITDLPEYYPTRTEIGILETAMPEIAEAVGPGRAVVDYGAGSLAKTPLLLEGIEPALYVPVDISGVHLRASAEALEKRFPGLPIEPVEADFTRPFDSSGRSRRSSPGSVSFRGRPSAISCPRSAVDLLRSFRRTLGTGALLLIGMDRVKDPARLVAAYDDAAGVTARFNRNLLERINRELGGTVPVEAFAHEARWNAALSRIEMHSSPSATSEFEIEGQPLPDGRGRQHPHREQPQIHARKQPAAALGRRLDGAPPSGPTRPATSRCCWRGPNRSGWRP